jgi:serine/threonine-protein kinase
VVSHLLVTAGQTQYLRGMKHILTKAVRALAHVHDERVVHRDIKPSNILLRKDRWGGVYLCDFGLARDLEFATAEQMRDGAGTPMYMAPERLLRFMADEVKCDIYSMGVTLFEALTLQRPYEVPRHPTYSGVVSFLALAEPRRPTAVCPDFPLELEAVIMKAMAPDQGRRYESAHQLAEELDRIHIDATVRSIRPRGVCSGSANP